MTTYSNDLLGFSNGLSLRESGIKDGFEWVDLDEVKPRKRPFALRRATSP